MKNYIIHASVSANSSGGSVGQKKKGSQYKGGFKDGKNTSEYNHDYYIHNKDKWLKKTGAAYDRFKDAMGYDERDYRDAAVKDAMYYQNRNYDTSKSAMQRSQADNANVKAWMAQRAYDRTPLGRIDSFVNSVKKKVASLFEKKIYADGKEIKKAPTKQEAFWARAEKSVKQYKKGNQVNGRKRDYDTRKRHQSSKPLVNERNTRITGTPVRRVRIRKGHYGDQRYVHANQGTR